MPDPLLLIVAVLGVFRVTILITEDKITEPIRNRILERWPAEDTAFAATRVFVNNDDGVETAYGRLLVSDGDYWYPEEGTYIGYLVTCPWCVSFWIALPVAVALALWPVVTGWVLLPFALSGVAAIIAEHA